MWLLAGWRKRNDSIRVWGNREYLPKKKKKKKIASLEVVKELEGLVGALVLSVLVEYLSLRVAFGTSNSKSL